MPFLLMCGMGFSAFSAAVMGLVLVFFAVTIPFTRTFTIDNAPVSRGEFLRFAAPIFAGVAAVGTMLGAIAYALWAERLWSRAVMMVFWGLLALVGALSLVWTPAAGFEVVAGFIELAIIAAIAYWYLYYKRSVASYYRALAGSRDRLATPATEFPARGA